MQCHKSLLVIKSTQEYCPELRCWWWWWWPGYCQLPSDVGWSSAIKLARHGSNVLRFIFFKIQHYFLPIHILNWSMHCSSFEENPTSFSCCWFTCRQQREYFSISLTAFSIIGEFNYIFLHPDSSFSHHHRSEYLDTCRHWTQIFWTKLQIQGFFWSIFVIIPIISGHVNVSLKVMDEMCVWTSFFKIYFSPLLLCSQNCSDQYFFS